MPVPSLRRKTNGVNHVVLVTALGRKTPVVDREGYVTVSLAMDDLIGAAGPPGADHMADTMSDALGERVRFQQIPFDAYKAQFLKFGFSEAMAQGMTDMAEAKSRGLDLGVARTPENTTPTSFRTWCREVLRPVILVA